MYRPRFAPGVSVDNRVPVNNGYWESWTVRPLPNRGQMNVSLFPTVVPAQQPQMLYANNIPEIRFNNCPLEQYVRGQETPSAQWSDPYAAGKKVDGIAVTAMKQDGRKEVAVKAKGPKNRWSERHKKDSCKCAVCKQCRGELQSTWYNHKQDTCKCSVCKQKRGESRVKVIPAPVVAPVSGVSNAIPRTKQSWTQPDERTHKKVSSSIKNWQRGRSIEIAKPNSEMGNARLMIPTKQWQPLSTPAQVSPLSRELGSVNCGCSSFVGTGQVSGSLNPGNQSSLQWQDRVCDWRFTGSTLSDSSRNYSGDFQNLKQTWVSPTAASFEGNVPCPTNTIYVSQDVGGASGTSHCQSESWPAGWGQHPNNVSVTPSAVQNTFRNIGSVNYEHDAVDPFGISHTALDYLPSSFKEPYPALLNCCPLLNRFSETNPGCVPMKLINSQPFGFSGGTAPIAQFPFGLEVQEKSGLEAAVNLGQVPISMDECDENAKLYCPPSPPCETIFHTSLGCEKDGAPVAVDSTSGGIWRSLGGELHAGNEILMTKNNEVTGEDANSQPKAHSVKQVKKKTGAGQEFHKQTPKLHNKAFSLHQKGTKRKQDSNIVAGPVPKWRRLLHTNYNKVTVVRKIYIRKRATEKSPAPSTSKPQTKTLANELESENSGRLSQGDHVEHRLEDPLVAIGLQGSQLAGTRGENITEDVGGFITIQRDGCVLTKPSVNGGLRRDAGQELEFFSGKECSVDSPESRLEGIESGQNVKKLISCTTPQLQHNCLPRVNQNYTSKVVHCISQALESSEATQQESCSNIRLGCCQDKLVVALSNKIRELKRPHICTVDDHLGRKVQSANALFQDILATLTHSGRTRGRIQANICGLGSGENAKISAVEFALHTGTFESKKKRRKSQNHEDYRFFCKSSLGTDNVIQATEFSKNSILISNSVKHQSGEMYNLTETQKESILRSVVGQLTARTQTRRQQSTTYCQENTLIDNQVSKCRSEPSHTGDIGPLVYGNLSAVLLQILRLLFLHETVGLRRWRNVLNGPLKRPRICSPASEIKEIANNSLEFYREPKLHLETLNKIVFSQRCWSRLSIADCQGVAVQILSPCPPGEQLCFERMTNTTPSSYLTRRWLSCISTDTNQNKDSKRNGASLDVAVKYNEHSEKGQHREMHADSFECDQETSETQHIKQTLGTLDVTSSQNESCPPHSFQELLMSVLHVNTVTSLVINNCPMRTNFRPAIDQIFASNNLPSTTGGDNSEDKTASSQCIDQIHVDNGQHRPDSSQPTPPHNSLPTIADLRVLKPQPVSRSDIGAPVTPVVNTANGQGCSVVRRRGCPKGGWPNKKRKFKNRGTKQTVQTVAAIDEDFEVLQPMMGKILSKEDGEYQHKLGMVLGKPFDAQELKNLEEAVCQRKPQLRLRETRHRGVHVVTKKDGFSYLDHHPDLGRKVADASTPTNKLRLLRGFFFWLQHSCMSGAFRPWCFEEKEDEENDDCMEYFPEETNAKSKQESSSRVLPQTLQKSCPNSMILRPRKTRTVKKKSVKCNKLDITPSVKKESKHV